ncbi:hypothetical protein ILUMI_23313 [Ignelater luminosus]|uniref:BESS domain-containing protein n=1 Tax=Ignelater luminosus TaxID=2038154 RepID=A0A8K0CC53_IGNLU|nr:hypothetical protein ILUMI_23313 [Ignelater luminosus]
MRNPLESEFNRSHLLKTTRLPTGSASKRRRTYTYGDQLSFLAKVTTPNNTSSTLHNVPLMINNDEVIVEGTQNVTTQDDRKEENATATSTTSANDEERKNSRKRKRSSVEDKFIQYLEVYTKVEEATDEHEDFFKSLLPTVRKFNEDQAMEFRAEVIQIMQKIRRGNPVPLYINHSVPSSGVHLRPPAAPASHMAYYQPPSNYHCNHYALTSIPSASPLSSCSVMTTSSDVNSCKRQKQISRCFSACR